ncbi:MAG TPA: hypothetical protein V6C93_25355 [Allocoleopsis sp.]
MSHQKHHHTVKWNSSNRQTLNQISLNPKPSLIGWIYWGAIIVLFLLVGAYYSLRLVMRMPGDGGTGLEQNIQVNQSKP